MGGAGRGARVVPTEESKTASSSHSAAAFTPVVPVDRVVDDPLNGAFGTALASSHADGQGCVAHPPSPHGVQTHMECTLPWPWPSLLWRLMHLVFLSFDSEPSVVTV